jgi:hypothetical protein
MQEADGLGQAEQFSSGVIDLGAFDLSAMDGLQNPVLRGAVKRARAGLADGAAAAFFESSLRDPQGAEENNSQHHQ